MKARFQFGLHFNTLSTVLACVGVGLFKFHHLTTFHVFTLLFSVVVFLLMYIERQERQYREEKQRKRNASKQIRRFFVQRANVLSAGVVWFYITYSIVAKDIFFERRNQVLTNLLSVSFACIALTASLQRKHFGDGMQAKVLVVYVLLLCFPMNLLQHTLPVVVGLRLFVFFLVFNLELYVGKSLGYHTTYKHLIMCSFFAFIVNEWYLVSAIPITLTHFLEIQGLLKRKSKRNERNPTRTPENTDTESVSSYFLSSSSSDSDVGEDVEVQRGKQSKLQLKPTDLLHQNSNLNMFSGSASLLGPNSTECEEIKYLLRNKRNNER